MIILFTGHRDRLANETTLAAIHNKYPKAKWLHGGAPGFDTQVHEFCIKHRIPVKVIRPDFEKYGREAPLVRDREMVNMLTGAEDFVVACYDGRKTGGTKYTMDYARGCGIRIKTIVARDLFREGWNSK